MLGWLLDGPRVTTMARTIHEMCCHAHHLRELGSPLHRYFTRHTMLKNHRAPKPTDRDQIHIFYLGDEQQRSEVMVCDGQQGEAAWLAVSPGGDFDGAYVQSGRKGRYMVRLDRPLARPLGRLARRLVNKFLSAYDARGVNG